MKRKKKKLASIKTVGLTGTQKMALKKTVGHTGTQKMASKKNSGTHWDTKNGF